ncbi:hypothetical protein P3T76_011589 [Phytophthora citrophthora]|uniref:RxLR effector protein n=1 Tax=Phytophthora citrophthora TaxID=4793 RepID=A0AAD9G8G1_9STRA|nr:hypothetical protein P3T76_011589 [Phytophthora citrophthora]
MRFPWILLLLVIAIVVVPSDAKAAVPTRSDFTTLTDDTTLQSKSLLRKAHDNKTDITEERGLIADKLRRVIAHVKKFYRDFKTELIHGKHDSYNNWMLYGAVTRR